MSNLRHWLWLSTRGPAPGMYAARVLEHFGTPEGAYYADSAAYGQIPGIPGTVRQALEDKDLTPAETILAKCKEQGIWILTMQDAAYPQRLRQLESAPCVLYGKGTLPQLDHLPVVAIVGARKASPYGVMAARQFGLALARQGILVVSGSAYGVDAAALNGALRGGGEVVSVLGNGIDVTYPAGHEDLYADVAAAGALLSEYPPGTPPAGAHFPVRNRLIAGLSLGVLVVEGTETSGALITARWALEAGRDVFAVPGGIDAPPEPGPQRPDPPGRGQAGPGRLGHRGGIPGPVPGYTPGKDPPGAPHSPDPADPGDAGAPPPSAGGGSRPGGETPQEAGDRCAGTRAPTGGRLPAKAGHRPPPRGGGADRGPAGGAPSAAGGETVVCGGVGGGRGHPCPAGAVRLDPSPDPPVGGRGGPPVFYPGGTTRRIVTSGSGRMRP